MTQEGKKVSKVSVVIPCRNEEDNIADCLKSVVFNGYPEELLEIFVSDGISSDRTRQIIRHFSMDHPSVVLIDNPELYTPSALNTGIKKSSGDVIIILGAHSVMMPGYIKQCIQILNEKPEVGCVGGQIISTPQNRKAEWIGKAMVSSFGVGNARFRTGGIDGYVDTVAFGAYRKEVFEKCGLFDEELLRNQDDEFNYRVNRSGYKIWFSNEIHSSYWVRASFKNLYRQYFQYGYWKVFVNRKYNMITSWRQLVPLIFVLWVLVGGIPSIFQPSLLWPWLAGLLAYCFSSLWFAARVSKLHEIPVLMYVFLILHLSYGLGYLEGIFWFMIFRRAPVKKRISSSR